MPSRYRQTAARVRSRAAVCLVLCVLGWRRPVAQAQAPSSPPEGTSPAFTIQSDNGDNRLQVGALVQLDGRFAVGDDQQLFTDTFVVRRFRSVLQGRLARHFDFFLQVDLAGNVVNVRDAYVDTRFSDKLRLRVGKFKAPFSYARLLSASSLLFLERGFTAAVAPDRDLGLQLLGDLAGTVVSYAASLTNGVADGGSSDTTDDNEGKDLTGRIVVSPWARVPTHPLARLGFGIAATTGEQSSALPFFQTSSRQTFFSYLGAVGNGRRTRWAPQAMYYKGPFGGYGEYVHSRGGIRKDALETEVVHEAWQVAASYVVTGESAGERNVRPRVNFDPPTNHWGALQLTARYHELSVSRSVLDADLTTPAASRAAAAYTLGANWYLNPFIKWNFNFERTTFDGDSRSGRRPENALLLRAQLVF